MAIFTALRTARKAYRCDDCRGEIKAGQKYASSAITPRDPDMGDADGKRWGRLRTHITNKECEQS